MKDCTVGCMDTCQDRCLKGDYLPLTDAKYCESNQCQRALQSRGQPQPHHNIVLESINPKSLESDLIPGLDIRDDGLSLHRAGDMIKTLDFSAENDWGQPSASQVEAGGGSVLTPITQIVPALDMEQLKVDGLSPDEIELIVKGPKSPHGLKSPVG